MALLQHGDARNKTISGAIHPYNKYTESCCLVQEDQKLVLDQQMSEKEKIRLDLQQAKVQDAQDIAVAVQQYKADEARSAAAKRAAALKTKDLMANQVGPACSW